MANRNFQSRFPSRGRAARRESIWIFQDPVDTTLAAASTAVQIGVLNAAALALRPFTVVRTRGVLWVRSDQVGSSEDYIASLGMAIVSDQASAIGVTAVPTPETDRNSDLFFVFETSVGGFSVFTSVGFSNQENQPVYFDSKAMRKVEEGQQLSITIETASISSGAQVLVASRMLLKLH